MYVFYTDDSLLPICTCNELRLRSSIEAKSQKTIC